MSGSNERKYVSYPTEEPIDDFIKAVTEKYPEVR